MFIQGDIQAIRKELIDNIITSVLEFNKNNTNELLKQLLLEGTEGLVNLPLEKLLVEHCKYNKKNISRINISVNDEFLRLF